MTQGNSANSCLQDGPDGQHRLAQDQIPVVLTSPADMPWPVKSPFRMLPGMARLNSARNSTLDSALFTRLPNDDAYRRAKRIMLDAGYGRVGQADTVVLETLARRYQDETGVLCGASACELAASLPEDFVILHDEPDEPQEQCRFRTRFLSVCFASNWEPSQKLGLDFEQIHAPVADNQTLISARRAIETMAFRQTSVRRFVWLLSPGAQLPQFPHLRARAWDTLLQGIEPGDPRLLDHVMFRLECQTTLPMPEIRRAVFLIRVLVCPLSEVLGLGENRPRELAQALQSMSEAVLAYRGLTQARARLLALLSPGSAQDALGAQ